jgi:hypothetical protein
MYHTTGLLIFSSLGFTILADHQDVGKPIPTNLTDPLRRAFIKAIDEPSKAW